MEIIPNENIKPLINAHNAKEVMDLYIKNNEEIFREKQSRAYQEIQNGKLKKDDFYNLEKTIHEDLFKKTPHKDGLTGAYTRAEFYTMIAIAKELGLSCRLTVVDMLNLKDHNKNLGEPFGGDYALKIFADKARESVDENGAVLIRFSGDDFIFLEFSSAESKFAEINLGEQISDQLSKITPEEYLSGKINNQTVKRADNGNEILLTPELVKALMEENSDLLQIIIPPNGVYDIYVINPGELIDQPDGIYEFSRVALTIQESMQRINHLKWIRNQELLGENPTGVRKLARSVT